MADKKKPTLDLHGCIKEEVFDLLDKFIMKHRHCDELCIIVGRGKGIVREQAIKYLTGAHYPWKYERVRGLENKGALIVDLS
ncbi:MAG: Smr/MutS family protein [Oligoflexia bacterium]|nr:Smr/MutS family protein [Bdellovibrionales bacterium]MYE07957.1 Smr/MutS family protein [Oligoflexia bacterium]